MNQMFNLVGGMWSHVGPGLLFVMALPVTLVLLGLVARSSYRRVGATKGGRA
jgi:hypothetical protein